MADSEQPETAPGNGADATRPRRRRRRRKTAKPDNEAIGNSAEPGNSAEAEVPASGNAAPKPGNRGRGRGKGPATGAQSGNKSRPGGNRRSQGNRAPAQAGAAGGTERRQGGPKRGGRNQGSRSTAGSSGQGRGQTGRSDGRATKVGRRNQWFQRVEGLIGNRTKRWQERLFVVEGVRAINMLADHPRWEVAALLYDDRPERSDWANQVIAVLDADEKVEMGADLFSELTARDDPSELLALVRIPAWVTTLPMLDEHELVVLLDRPSSPGNLGAILRSCDALGCSQVVVLGHAADPFDPAAVRATTGSLFTVDVFGLQEEGSAIEEWLEELKDEGVRLIGTSAHAATQVWEADLTGPTLLMIGNETTGLSSGLQERCDAMIGLEMGGSASSLNVAAAATVFLYEATRQRQRDES